MMMAKTVLLIIGVLLGLSVTLISGFSSNFQPRFALKRIGTNNVVVPIAHVLPVLRAEKEEASEEQTDKEPSANDILEEADKEVAVMAETGEEEKKEEEPFFLLENTKDDSRTQNNYKSSNNEKNDEMLKNIISFVKETAEIVLPIARDVATDLFVALRWRAANALTASLPENERRELLARMEMDTEAVPKKVGDDEDEELSLSQMNSVNENIAAAVAAESKRNKEQWEREKDEIYKQAQQAAQERVESDLAIQKQRMEKEKRQLQVKAEAAKAQLEQELKQQQEAAEKQEQEEQSNLEKELKENQEQSLKYKAEIDSLQQELREAQMRAQKKEEEKTSVEKEEDSKSDEIELRRYTAREYHAMSDEDKEKLKTLREANPELAFAETTTTDEEEDIHPLLGPVIEDLGYKRIHKMSAGKLGTIPIWKKQRIYRHNRVKAMANDKWKSMNLGLPGIICLHEDKDGRLSVIDGQHRIGMMMLLRDKQRKEQAKLTSSRDSNEYIDFDNVLVEVYPEPPKDDDTTNATDMSQDLFLEINKAEPIKLVDMPGVAKAKDRNIITEAVDRLYDRYPDMFSANQRCRSPNLNVDNLRNSLFGADVLKKHNLTTTKKLLDWILEQNKLMGDKYENDEEEQGSIGAKAWKKASENKFYLGLDSTWLYN